MSDLTRSCPPCRGGEAISQSRQAQINSLPLSDDVEKQVHEDDLRLTHYLAFHALSYHGVLCGVISVFNIAG